MKTVLTTLALLISLTMITACSSSSNDVKPTVISNSSSLPTWYTQPQEDDKSYIYGLGQGDNRKSAINSALNDAVSTLNVSVSSRFQQQTSSRTSDGVEAYDKESRESIDVVTNELTLNNYEVIKHQHLSNGTDVAMIRVNKHKLFQSLYDDLDNAFKMLDATLQNKSDTLEIILIYRKYMGIIKKRIATLGVLQALNPAFDAEEVKERYKRVISAHNQLVENKFFKLKINDPYGAYASTIRKGLMQDGVKLTQSDDYDYIVRVNIEEQSEIAVRRQVVTFLSTTFSVGIGDNRSSKDIFYTTFQLKSESDSSIEKARELIKQKLEKKIEYHGVFNISGN